MLPNGKIATVRQCHPAPKISNFVGETLACCFDHRLARTGSSLTVLSSFSQYEYMSTCDITSAADRFAQYKFHQFQAMELQQIQCHQSPHISRFATFPGSQVNIYTLTNRDASIHQIKSTGPPIAVRGQDLAASCDQLGSRFPPHLPPLFRASPCSRLGDQQWNARPSQPKTCPSAAQTERQELGPCPQNRSQWGLHNWL